MRIGIVGMNYAPEEIGIGRYSTDMAVALVERGHDVSVIVGKPYYPAWKGQDAYRGGLWRKARERGVEITRCAHYIPANPTGLRRIAHLISFALTAMVPAIRMAFLPRERRPQVIICVAPALLSVPTAWVAAKVTRAKLLIHVQDFEVEAALATGLVGERGVTARMARMAEDLILRLGDAASSISPQMCDKLIEKGFAPQDVMEIRNWADSTCVFTTTQDTPYRERWNLGTRKVCLYSGNIANKQGIDILVEVARKLERRKDLAFVICGQGPTRVTLEKLAEGLTNIQFHDLQPMGAMGDLLSLADIHLLPQIPGAADLMLPSKLTNMLASGRPVVACAAQGTGLYHEVEGCGINVPPGDVDALVAAVEALADDPERCKVMGDAGRERAVERWSIGKIIDRLEAWCHQLAERRGPSDQAPSNQAPSNLERDLDAQTSRGGDRGQSLR